MAKKSMLEREKKRELCAQKFAAKRQALKEAGDYEALSKLPRNASPDTSAQPLQTDRPSPRLYA